MYYTHLQFNITHAYIKEIDNIENVDSAMFWYHSGFFIVNFEHISDLFLVFLLLTLSMYLPAGMFSFCGC